MATDSLYQALLTMEPLVFFVGAVVSVVFAVKFWPLSRNRMFFVQANPGLGIVRAAVVFSFLWFLWVMGHGADGNIVGYYTWLYVFLSLACLLVMSFWRPMLGIYQLADIVERGNLAAALTLAGFVFGTAFAFGGALTGQDLSCFPPNQGLPICAWVNYGHVGVPYGYGGWYVVLVFFLLAYFELRANMKLVHRFGGDVEDGVRLDRDPSAGILLGGVAMASGLISGRAAAGDFVAWKPAFIDYFQRLWPLIFVPAIGTVAGRISGFSNAPLRYRSITAAALVAGGLAYYFFT